MFLKDTMVSKVSQQSHFRLCFWFYNLQKKKKTGEQSRITEFLVSVSAAKDYVKYESQQETLL